MCVVSYRTTSCDELSDASEDCEWSSGFDRAIVCEKK